MMKKPEFLDHEFNLPQLEEKVLTFWDERGIFEKSLKKNKTAKAKRFVFYEGPPYANGKPALHHVLARVVKDVVLRYKTMRGYYVPRRAGWDTHGLPVEMAAEKALGFKTKRDIEQFGVKRFNEEAKKQVWIHKDEWERLTQRIGYWLDLKNAYVTYAPEYIESIWWTLAQIAKRKVGGESLLFKGHKVVPWCTRCGTALSSHELAQGYKEVSDRSVYVKFKLKNPEKIGLPGKDVYILSWTTTPWTLPGNVALAVGEKIEYEAISFDSNSGSKDFFIFAKDLEEKIHHQLQLAFPMPENPVLHLKEAALIKGQDLIGLAYEPLFEVAPLKSPNSYKVYAADFVTTTDGTGVVHTAVMYGEDDYELGKKVGLPQRHTVDEEGKFMKDVPALAGEYAKARETEDHIFEHLRAHGNLLRIEEFRHEYPFCWRCGTPVLYYARTSWFIGMSHLRQELLKNNETIHWMPEHIREGRFGEWLKEAKDWNLSRERYWGAPLPIWECAKCGRTEVIESLDQLSERAGGGKNRYWAMRHGESENILFHITDSGDQNCHLTPRGKKQILQTAKSLKGKKIDLIFASDLVRTQESAEMLSKELGVPVHFDKRLREIYLASLSGKPGAEYARLLPTQEERFSKPAAENAETLRDVRSRVWDFVRDTEKQHQGKNILIVSHEDTIWMLAEVANGWSERVTADKKNLNKGVFMKPAEVIAFAVKTIPRDDTGLVDLHRPFVDEIIFRCTECGGEMKRVREVADVWYDSGAMPYAQAHYPFENAASIGRGRGKDAAALMRPNEYPADYIAEGMDQLRGWFYTLIAIATVLAYEAPYRNVITFGLMNDKFGNKMSKSKGNVIEPFEIINKYGVDAVRWYFYSGTPFSEPKNFDEQEVAKSLRKVHMIVYNSFIFWKTYAKQGKIDQAVASGSKHILDQWIQASFAAIANSVTSKLDNYEIREAALEIERFVDDLSRWFIRRSRKRLQRPESSAAGRRDYEAASATLGFILMELIKLMAPFTPFFSEVLYSALGGSKESVHLEDWPKAGSARLSAADKSLIEQMKLVRDFAALGLAKRAEAGIKVRQPLAMLYLAQAAGKKITKKELLDILADEVNVKKVLADSLLKEGVKLDTTITPELREEGWLREVARMVQELRQKAGLEPKDRVALMLQLPDNVRAAIEKYEAALKSDVGAKTVEYKHSEKFEAEDVAKIDGRDAWVGVRKVK